MTRSALGVKPTASVEQFLGCREPTGPEQGVPLPNPTANLAGGQEEVICELADNEHCIHFWAWPRDYAQAKATGGPPFGP